jgi:hypothetical protein
MNLLSAIRRILLLSLLLVAAESLAANELKWEKTYPESEAPYFVRVDKSGNVYVIGRYFVESPENAEVFVKKYSPDSTLIWSDTTSGTDLKIPIAAELDAAGNVFVLAQFGSDAISPSVLYRFNAVDGVVAWSQEFFPPGNFKQSAMRDLVVDNGGNVEVCVNFVVDDPAQPLRSDSKSYLLRYSSGGSLLWQREAAFSEPSVAYERLKTSGSTIYVIGTTLDLAGSYEGFVLGYNLSGDSLWIGYSGLNPLSGVFGQGSSLDSTGNLLTVFSDSDSTIYRKFSAAGGILFSRTSPRLGFSFKHPVTSDRNGNFFWIITDDLGNQRLQSRQASGDIGLDLILGNFASPFPIVFAGNNSLLSWSPDNRATQYSLAGTQLWQSAEEYSSLGDFAANNRGETYWILYLFDDFVPDLLYRKLVKYDLGGMCGDINASGRIDITDAVHMVNYIFASGPPPRDRRLGDIDCNHRTDISDIVFLINYLFGSGPAPCASCP